jgi:tRNA A37 threonylcarbamoyladenosine modification protein TsaB
MILKIDTTNGILVEVSDHTKVIARFISAESNKQSELLLKAIEKVLIKAGTVLGNIKKIAVVDHGGSFTSLRIGITTANALGFALRIPVIANDPGKKGSIRQKTFVMPKYSREPNINLKKKI